MKRKCCIASFIFACAILVIALPALNITTIIINIASLACALVIVALLTYGYGADCKFSFMISILMLLGYY